MTVFVQHEHVTYRIHFVSKVVLVAFVYLEMTCGCKKQPNETAVIVLKSVLYGLTHTLSYQLTRIKII